MDDESRREQSESAGAQFQVLRAHLEREVRAPGVVIVTSAEHGDGKSLTALSLAECLSRAGRRAALVVAKERKSGPSDSAPEPDDEPYVARVRKPRAALRGEAAAEFLRSMRSSYDFTIVDAGPLLRDDFALGLVGRVDGVLVSVRVGRAQSDADDMMVRVVAQSSGRIVGVVAVLPEAIAEFKERCLENRSTESGHRINAAGKVNPIRPLAVSVRS